MHNFWLNRIIVVKIAACLLFPLTLPAKSQNQSLNILFISSFSKNPPSQILFEKGLTRALGQAEGSHKLFFEFMEVPRFDEKDVSAALVPYLRQKYKNFRIDCIIGWAPSAILFLSNNEDLFPEAYTVYIEPGGLEIDQDILARRRTSVIDVDYDHIAAFNEIVQLTDPKKVYVIGSSKGTSAQNRLKRFQESLSEVGIQPEVEYLLDQTMEDVATRLESASPYNSIAMYLLMLTDGKGKQMAPFQVARYLTSRSSIPVFSYWASLVGGGIVGGYLFTHEKVGFELGKVIPKIVRDEKIDQISSMQHIYDWNQLEKWKIDEEKLPENAIILNRPPDIWTRYRYQIISGSIFLLFQSLMIVLLLANIRRRKKAEQELLAYQKTLEQKVEERTISLNRSNYSLQYEITVRKRIERTLRESEEKFRGIVENSKGIIFVIDKNGYFTLSEGYSLSGLGLKPGQVVGMNAFELYKDYPIITSAFSRALAGETVHDPHLEVQGIEDQRHYNIFYTPFSVNNSVEGIIGEAIDITNHVRSENLLTDEKERAQNYLDIAATMILALDHKGRVTLINKRGCEIIGYEEDEILGKVWIEHFIPEDKRPYAKEAHKQMKSGDFSSFKEVDDFPILAAKGEKKLISWHNSLIKKADGSIVGALSSGIDITKSKQIELEREKLIQELQDALSKIKTLSGFLPICASCKKVRDDDGYWKQIESYIEDHSDALFSHSVCPDCMEQLYPKTHQKLKKEGKL